MRILGIDLGIVRIGVAITDQSAIFASPLTVIQAGGIKKNAEKILNLANKYNCELIVFGMPYELDGSKGKIARKVEKLIVELKKSFKGKIDTIDERFTSVEAERALIDGDTSRAKRKQKIDKVAAALILQSYIDFHGGNFE